MSIETELIAAKGHLDDCYDVVGIKGGTVPQNECLANLPTAINSIVPYISTEPCGYIIENNIVKENSGQSFGNILQNFFTPITTIDKYGLAYSFFNVYGFQLNELNFTNLTKIDEYGMYYLFGDGNKSSDKNCSINVIKFPSLTQIGQYGLYQAFTKPYDSTRGGVSVGEFHFRADAQSIIEGAQGYGNKFGAGSGAIIYFDL